MGDAEPVVACLTKTVLFVPLPFVQPIVTEVVDILLKTTLLAWVVGVETVEVVLKKTERLLCPFVKAKSGLPSPLRSPMETELGELPVVKSVLEEKEGVAAPLVVVFKNTETLSATRFAVAKSGFPSPLRSPMETEEGILPVVKSVLEEKEGVAAPLVVVLKNTETLSEKLFATAKSGLPSPLRSPMETETGLLPVVRSVLEEKVGVAAPLVVVLKNTEILSEKLFATTKSGLPSPLRSPMEIEKGLLPVVKSVLEEKEGVVAPLVVVFKNTETLSELLLATAKSGLPSPLRSPMETEVGPLPVVKSVLEEKGGVVAPLVVVFRNT